MSRRPIVAGNWKMYKTTAEAVEFVTQLSDRIEQDEAVDILLAAPFTMIARCSEAVKKEFPIIGAQNMHDATDGAYTGEIAAKMLIDAGAKFVILGHSERRHIFKETNAFIQKKVKKALQEKILPILCIGETLQDRDQQKTNDVLQQQLKECLEGLSAENIEDHLVIAYEPVWAIGTGHVATPDMAEEAHRFCRQWLQDNFNEDCAKKIRIIYGGSVNSQNCDGLFQMNNIDGALVGGASLDVDKFFQIITAAKNKGSVV